jgi:hypothetical protein
MLMTREKKKRNDTTRTNNRDKIASDKISTQTHHLSIEKCIVKVWIGFEELAAQKSSICHVLEEGHVDGIGLVVRQCKGADQSHGGEGSAGLGVVMCTDWC